MVQNKKKISLWLVLMGAFMSAYGGYLLNGAWEPGIGIHDFLDSFNRVCAKPLRIIIMKQP